MKKPVERKPKPKPRPQHERASPRREWEFEAAPPKKLLLTDVALRDGHQSLLATRMRTEDLLPVPERLDKVGYWSLEVWCGATFNTGVRLLKAVPWERLRALKRLASR